MKYEVEVTYEVKKTILVEANNDDQAREEAGYKVFVRDGSVISGSVQFLRCEKQQSANNQHP